MKSVIKSLDALQKNPDDYQSRANLAWAAVLSLNGISAAGMNGGDWATHKLQHGISAIYPEVAHAPGLTAIFPAWIEYCRELNKPQFLRWAKEIWNANSVEEGIENMCAKFKQWGSPTSIKELEIPKDSYPEIVENTLGIAPVVGGLKKLSKEDITQIYEMAW
jgi:alcohol dehydrogenase YqhD (iron-dependent ADH family)